MTEALTLIWRMAILVIFYFVFREIYYISELLSAYVRMLMSSGVI
jgi:hypothetical protein